MTVRTRFAPSPTGFLHVGSARTALFSWLWARHTHGEFILRIEDTDRERSKIEFEHEIIESLKWLGIDWDGEIYYQSKRSALYRKYADILLEKKVAYAEGSALRFKGPKKMISWKDAVRGRIEFDGKLLDDLVIMKSDGSPTYNFACVCDDGEMAVTHVVRGEDHISNTPKQIPLYEALGFPIPIFAHIPLILGKDRSRLSKRHGATSIRDFKEAGYLPQAMMNYLSLLGWSPGQNQEIIGREELIEKFDLNRVLSTGAIFNREKMDWLNGEYLRAMPLGELKALYLLWLRKAGVIKKDPDDSWMDRFTELHRLRVFVMGDLASQTDYFFKEEVEWKDTEDQFLRKHTGIGDVFLRFAETLSALSQFDHDSLEKASRALMQELNLSGKQFIHPARIAVTGRKISPSFFETLALLGKEQSVKRLRKAAQKLNTAVAG